MSSTLGLPRPAESVQYILSENTNQDGSYLPFLNTTENVNMDDKHYIPHGRHDGVITHVDDSGTETTLFLAHESPYVSSNTSVLVKSNPMSVDQFVGASLLQGPRNTDLVLSNPQHQRKTSGQIDITSTAVINDTTGNSDQISVSNLDPFPFTLTVDSSQGQL